MKESIPILETEMLGTIRTVSKRDSGTQPRPDEVVIDVDRSNPILGNPFIMGRDGDRLGCIRKHNRLIKEDRENDGPISHELEKIAQMVRAGQNVALRCWCAPKQCHADNYVKKIVKMVTR